MSHYTHPQPKMNWFFKKFENSAHFHALKMTSRLVGLVCLLTAFFFTDNEDIMLAYFAAGILLTDILFFCIGKRESHYKTKAAFEAIQATPKTLDKYNNVLLLLKALLFIVVPIAPVFISFYGGFCVVIAAIVAGELNFRGAAPVHRKSSLDDRYGYNSPQSSSTNMMYGVAGYDVAGVYTGSPTAIGGVSS